MPDHELFELAKPASSTSRDVLEAQVRRMLKDPKSKALAEDSARNGSASASC